MSDRESDAHQRMRHLRYSLAERGLGLSDLQEAIEKGLITKEKLQGMKEEERQRIALMLLQQVNEEKQRSIQMNVSKFKVCFITFQDVIHDPVLLQSDEKNVVMDIQHLRAQYGLEASDFTLEEIRHMVLDESVVGVSLLEVNDVEASYPMPPIGYVLTKDGVLLDVTLKKGIQFLLP